MTFRDFFGAIVYQNVLLSVNNPKNLVVSSRRKCLAEGLPLQSPSSLTCGNNSYVGLFNRQRVSNTKLFSDLRRSQILFISDFGMRIESLPEMLMSAHLRKSSHSQDFLSVVHLGFCTTNCYFS